MKKCFLSLVALSLFSFGMKSDAQWNLTGNSNATAASILGTTNAIPLNLATTGVKRLTIDAAGNVGIGTATPVNILTIKGAGSTPAASWVNAGAPLFTGFGETTVGNADYILSMASAASNARPVFIGRRGRGTLAAPAVVASNDYLMSFLSSGFDGNAFQNPAAIDFYVDGTPTAGNVPARISFVTGTNGSNRAERLKIGSTGNIVFNNTQLFLDNASGNVGIGTAAPSQKLDVVGSAAFSGNLSAKGATVVDAGSTNNGTLSAGGSLRFGDPLYTGEAIISKRTAGGNQYGLDFLVGAFSRLSITNIGNVGIGITTPTNKLEVSGGNALIDGNLSITKNTSLKGIVGINGDTLAGTALLIKADATHEGIRVKDPIDKYVLYADKSGANNGIYVVKSSTTSSAASIAGVGTGTSMGLEGYGSANNGVYAQSDSAAGLYAYSANNFGLYAESGDLASYAGYFNGDVFSTGSFTSSDARLKNNIKDFGNAMQLLNALQPRSYDFKQEGQYAMLHLPHGNHYGLIAQDLEKVLPNLVKETNLYIKDKTLQPGKDNGFSKGRLVSFKAVNYTELVPVMLKGMQELSTTNEQLKTDNDQLKKEMADLKGLVMKFLNSTSTAPCPPMAGK